MNPFDWEAIQRLQGSLDPNHQTVVNNSMGNVSRANNDWDTYCQYSRYTVDEPQSNMGVNLGLKVPPSQNFYIKESEVEDPDGEPYEMEEVEKDPELKRKWNELREIEEKIMHKKVAIALKKVETFAKDTSPPSFSHNEQSAMCKGATLKDRVNAILQQRHSVSFLSKVQSPKSRMNSSSLSKDALLQEDNPLKLRVKALMKQRCSGPCVLPANKEVPDATPTPPSRSMTSSANNSVNQGFQRFLSVLNKGVDMDLLSRIVNDDSEDLPLGQELLNVQPPTVDNKSDLPFRSENKQSSTGVSLLGHSWTNSGERKTNPPSQETSLNDHLPDDDEKKNDSGHICFGSSSRSRSPPAVKKKEVEEEKPKVDEQHVQLQNILNSLGLSMEVEEMSKLADRTQERLYGKKRGGIKTESRREREGQQRGFHRQDRNSSSSSISTSSRSTSRSYSPSPSRRRHSHSRDLKQRQTSERSSSRDRSRDGPTGQDGNQDSEEAQKHRDRDKDGKDSKETSPYQHPYPQNQTYPHADTAAFSAFTNYSLPQYSQYDAYHSDSYSAATNSYWTYTQGAIPPSLYPSEHCPPQNTDHRFLLNPDLSKSEGQIGSTSRPRCLQVITTKPTLQSYLKQLTKSQKKNRQKKKRKILYQR